MQRKKIFSVVILLVIIVFTITAFKKNIPQVVCFGDSITYGAKVDGHSWVWFLSKNHADVNFINAGRSGRKTSDKEELLPVLKQYPHANYYLVFLGVNDLKNGNDSMVNNCVENMEWMINKIHETDPAAKIIILAPCEINLKTMSAINVQKKYNENTKRSLIKLAKQYKRLAKKENSGFISLLDVVSPPNYADGLHPDTTGQKQITARVWEDLKNDPDLKN